MINSLMLLLQFLILALLAYLCAEKRKKEPQKEEHDVSDSIVLATAPDEVENPLIEKIIPKPYVEYPDIPEPEFKIKTKQSYKKGGKSINKCTNAVDVLKKLGGTACVNDMIPLFEKTYGTFKNPTNKVISSYLCTAREQGLVESIKKKSGVGFIWILAPEKKLRIRGKCIRGTVAVLRNLGGIATTEKMVAPFQKIYGKSKKPTSEIISGDLYAARKQGLVESKPSGVGRKLIWFIKK